MKWFLTPFFSFGAPIPRHFRSVSWGTSGSKYRTLFIQVSVSGGSRSWRNNNPGNLISGEFANSRGAIGQDGDGFAIFPDEATAESAKESLVLNKWGADSVRDMLKGKFDENGNYINGSGYAPASDDNNPDQYADFIKKKTGVDVDNKTISELTQTERAQVLDAMRQFEGYSSGNRYMLGQDGKLVPEPGSKYLLAPLNDIINGTTDICEQRFDDAQTATPPRRIDPLILDLDGDGIETVIISDGAQFDHDGNGFAELTGWVAHDDGLLVFDRNGDGIINDGKELFGDQTLLNDGTRAVNAFQALAELDENADGKIDSSDSAWANLKVWQDFNGDGVSDSGEFWGLAELGIQSINVGYTETNVTDSNGNIQSRLGSYTKTDGTTRYAGEYLLQRDLTHTVANDYLTVSADIASLPDLRGYGNVHDLQQAIVRDATGTLKTLVESFVAETSPGNRNALFEQILFTWTGADTIDPASRGGSFDARKLAALEKFYD